MDRKEVVRDCRPYLTHIDVVWGFQPHVEFGQKQKNSVPEVSVLYQWHTDIQTVQQHGVHILLYRNGNKTLLKHQQHLQ